MKMIVNPTTGRTVREFESTEERLAWQNANYRKFRANLENDPAKLDDYKRRKREASNKCNAAKRAKIAAMAAELEALKAANNQ